MKRFLALILILLLCAAGYLLFNLSPRQFTLKDIEPVESAVVEEPSSAKHAVEEASLATREVPDTHTKARELAPEAQVLTGSNKSSTDQVKKSINSASDQTKEAKVPEADPNAYYIIIEGFKNLPSAQERANILSRKFNTEMVVLPPTHAGIFRISYGKYATYDQAETALIKVRIKIRPEAWILSPKK